VQFALVRTGSEGIAIAFEELFEAIWAEFGAISLQLALKFFKKE